MSALKFLIVEDEAIIAMQLQMNLRKAGYLVSSIVGRGKDAIAHAHSENPDVILMDIGLAGEMDGIEAARQISVFSPAAIVFTTGYLDLYQKGRAMALHPAAYLIKPVEINQVESVLAHYFL